MKRQWYYVQAPQGTCQGLYPVISLIPQPLNYLSAGVINSMSLGASFPVTRRVSRTSDIPIPKDVDLEQWISSVGVEVGPLVPSPEHRLQVLALLYHYRHLNGIDLKYHPKTDLIE